MTSPDVIYQGTTPPVPWYSCTVITYNYTWGDDHSYESKLSSKRSVFLIQFRAMKPKGPRKTHFEPYDGKSFGGGFSGKEGVSDLPIMQDGNKTEKTQDSRSLLP